MGGAAPTRPELAAMIGKLDHRGPDGTGLHCEGAIGLAHARLAIIDLSSGDQPIHNEDKTIQVVFNGEIFNYIELRAELQRAGHRFYTQSDTEVIVHAYEEYGDDFLTHLNGQFAIALWDLRVQRLVLARDRTGIRPLFYANVAGRLVFASEAKALFALPEVPRKLDPAALTEIFTFWAPIGSRAVFAGVQSLEPGQMMVVQNGRAELKKYWDWQFPDAPIREARSADEFAEELRALMIDAVRLQLRSDVPVGAYLSGGLDSSVITSLIHHFTDTPLRTFSITFEDEEFDESPFQKELVDHLGTQHSQVRCKKTDIATAFGRTLWHTESPILRTAPVPLMLLSESVRAQGYKVVLTGEGADEVFGGYDLFKEAAVRRFMARQPASKMRPALLKRLYPYLKNSPAASGAFAQRFFSDGIEHLNEPFFAHTPRWTTTGRISQFFSNELRDATAGWDAHAAIRKTLPDNMHRWPPIGRDQYVEAHTLMSGYLLNSQGDRMAMANSIEGRFPFLDHRVIEFANRLPPRYKLMGLTEKWLLKRSMKGLLPESVRTRSKQPYRAPDSQSFFIDGKAHEQVAELLNPTRLKDAGWFDPAAVGKLVEKCRAGRAMGFADNMAFVGILSTMWIDELFVRGPHVAARP